MFSPSSKAVWLERYDRFVNYLKRPSTRALYPQKDADAFESIDFYSSVSTNELIPGSEASGVPPLDAEQQQSWRWRLVHFFFFDQSWFFLLLLGIMVALVGLGMDMSRRALYRLIDGVTQRLAFSAFRFALHLSVSVGCAALAYIITDRVAPTAAGSGIPVIKSMLSGIHMPQYFNARTLFAKVSGLLLSFGAGLSIGEEGPYVHVAACVASLLFRAPGFGRIRRSPMLRTQLIAAGCAAGVATAFGAPIGGVLFSIEVTASYYLVSNLWKGFFCAAAAAALVMVLGESGMVAFFITRFDPQPYEAIELLVFAGMGVVFGLGAVAWISTVKKLLVARERYAILDDHPALSVAAVTLLTATLTYSFAMLGRNEHQVLNGLFDAGNVTQGWGLGNIFLNLAFYTLAKFYLTALAVTLPLPVGLYTPVFMTGAAAGRFIGELLRVCVPSWAVVPGGYAVVGAAAFSAGVTRTLSTAVIVFEVTGQLHHLLAVLVAVLISSAVAQAFVPSVYDVLLMFKGLPYLPSYDPTHTYQAQHARHIMQRLSRGVPRDGLTYSAAESLLQRYHELRHFPMIADDMRLVGAVPRRLLEQLVRRRAREWDAACVAAAEAAAAAADDDETTAEDTETHDDSRAPTTTAAATTAAAATSALALLSSPTKRARAEAAVGAHALALLVADAGARVRFFDALVSDDIRTYAVFDPCPYALSPTTPVSKVYLIFTLLGLEHAYVVSESRLYGVITKENLLMHHLSSSAQV